MPRQRAWALPVCLLFQLFIAIYFIIFFSQARYEKQLKNNLPLLDIESTFEGDLNYRYGFYMTYNVLDEGQQNILNEHIE